MYDKLDIPINCKVNIEIFNIDRFNQFDRLNLCVNKILFNKNYIYKLTRIYINIYVKVLDYIR